MSEAADLVDAVLAHVVTAVSGVATRNAVTLGFEEEAAHSDYPFCQGLAVSFASSVEAEGQEDTEWILLFQLLQDKNKGEDAWTQIDALRVLIQGDYTLGALARRTTITEAIVDEMSNAARTSTTFEVTAQVFR